MDLLLVESFSMKPAAGNIESKFSRVAHLPLVTLKRRFFCLLRVFPLVDFSQAGSSRRWRRGCASCARSSSPRSSRRRGSRC